MNRLSIFDPMPFGKYEDHLVGSVCESDPEYLDWAINNTKLRLDEGALDYLRECVGVG